MPGYYRNKSAQPASLTMIRERCRLLRSFCALILGQLRHRCKDDDGVGSRTNYNFLGDSPVLALVILTLWRNDRRWLPNRVSRAVMLLFSPLIFWRASLVWSLSSALPSR